MRTHFMSMTDFNDIPWFFELKHTNDRAPKPELCGLLQHFGRRDSDPFFTATPLSEFLLQCVLLLVLFWRHMVFLFKCSVKAGVIGKTIVFSKFCKGHSSQDTAFYRL